MTDNEKEAFLIAQTAQISLNGEMLKQLHGTVEDLGTVPYESIKNRLIDLKLLHQNIKFFTYMRKEETRFISWQTLNRLHR